MEHHSLVLLSGSTLDTYHHKHFHASARRTQPVPLGSGPPRPLRSLANGLTRLLPQLRQLSRRLRRSVTPGSANANATTNTTTVNAPAPVIRSWDAAADEAAGPSTSAPSSTIHASQAPELAQQHQCPTLRWRAPRWRRAQRPTLQQQQQQHVGLLPDGSQVPQQQVLLQLPEKQEQSHQQEAHSQGLQLQQQEQEHHHFMMHTHVPLVQRRRELLRRLGCALRFLGSRMRPQGPGEHDKTAADRALNVATCAMFFQAGGRILRLCRSLAARRFGWAFIAVGVVASVYHGSWGRCRGLARKVDYYAIAASSLLLRSALVGPVPRWMTAAMLVATPFRPTLVSGSNFIAVEVRYLMLALSERRLLSQWAAHTGMSVAASACFGLDHTPLLAWFPFTHAAFHVLSAAAFLTLPNAMNHLTAAAEPVAAA